MSQKAHEDKNQADEREHDDSENSERTPIQPRDQERKMPPRLQAAKKESQIRTLRSMKLDKFKKNPRIKQDDENIDSE